MSFVSAETIAAPAVKREYAPCDGTLEYWEALAQSVNDQLRKNPPHSWGPEAAALWTPTDVKGSRFPVLGALAPLLKKTYEGVQWSISDVPDRASAAESLSSFKPATALMSDTSRHRWCATYLPVYGYAIDFFEYMKENTYLPDLAVLAAQDGDFARTILADMRAKTNREAARMDAVYFPLFDSVSTIPLLCQGFDVKISARSLHGFGLVLWLDARDGALCAAVYDPMYHERKGKIHYDDSYHIIRLLIAMWAADGQGRRARAYNMNDFCTRNADSKEVHCVQYIMSTENCVAFSFDWLLACATALRGARVDALPEEGLAVATASASRAIDKHTTHEAFVYYQFHITAIIINIIRSWAVKWTPPVAVEIEGKVRQIQVLIRQKTGVLVVPSRLKM